MDKFYLKAPQAELKSDIIDYLDEFRKYNSDLNGFGMLARVSPNLVSKRLWNNA